MVNPAARTVQVFWLENGNYVGRGYGDTDTVSVAVLEGCRIGLADVFPALPGEAPENAEATAG